MQSVTVESDKEPDQLAERCKFDLVKFAGRPSGKSPLRMKDKYKNYLVTAGVVVAVIVVLKLASGLTSRIPVVGPYLQL